MDKQTLRLTLERIANSLEALVPQHKQAVDLTSAQAYIWHAQDQWLQPVAKVQGLDLDLLLDLNNNVDVLIENTTRFAQGLPANNALLWGARGMGKSSFVKAVFKAVNAAYPSKLALIEVQRDDLKSLPYLLSQLGKSQRRFVLFCDDLSFDEGEESYKSLKVFLDGSVAGKPDNVIMYATSNRRHLISESIVDNERRDAIHPNEAVEEKVSLSDRFGLWLGFYHCSEQAYLDIVKGYCQSFKLEIEPDILNKEAKAWAMSRGSRSGRVAWQYVVDLAGRQGKKI